MNIFYIKYKMNSRGTMDKGRKRVEWHSWRGTAPTQVQGQAVHSIWLENKALGEGQGEMRSARLASRAL